MFILILDRRPFVIKKVVEEKALHKKVVNIQGHVTMLRVYLPGNRLTCRKTDTITEKSEIPLL